MCNHSLISSRIGRLATGAAEAMAPIWKPVPRALCAALGGIAFLLLVGHGGTSAMAQIEFDDFCDVSSLTLNGDSTPLTPNPQCVLRLTGSSGDQSGSAFTTQPFSVASDGSFSTKFCFRITASGGAGDGDGDGADGVTFILQTRPDLLDEESVSAQGGRGWVVAGILISLVVVLLSPFASANPDGLERVAEDLGFLNIGQAAPYTILPDYTVPFLGETSLSTIVAGIIGALIVLGVAILAGRSLQKKT